MLNANQHKSILFQALDQTTFKTPKGDCSLQNWLEETVAVLAQMREKGQRLYFIGNGASASMSSHFSTDFTKNGNFQAFSFNDPALLTCFSNDYSYEDAYMEMMKRYFKPGDGLFAISSSGNSKNILRAATLAKEISPGRTFGFSGFKPDNGLKKMSDFGVYVPNHDYGFVETSHSYYMHMLIDTLCGMKV